MIPLLAGLLSGGDNLISWIFQFGYIIVFVVFMFYSQRIQMMVMIREVESHLRRLKFIRDDGRKVAVETIKEIGKPEEDPAERIDQFLEYIAITPQSMDPSGIVWKLEHILDVRDVRFKDEVKLIAPEADETQLNNLENTKTDAFPSGHTAIALLSLYYAWKFREKTYTTVLVPSVLALILSTVYLRYHYVIDVIAGVLLAALTIIIAPALSRLLSQWSTPSPVTTGPDGPVKA